MQRRRAPNGDFARFLANLPTYIGIGVITGLAIAGFTLGIIAIVNVYNLDAEEVTNVTEVTEITNVNLSFGNGSLATCSPANDGDYFTFNMSGSCLQPVDLNSTLGGFDARITALENAVPFNYSIEIAVERLRIDDLEADVAGLNASVIVLNGTVNGVIDSITELTIEVYNNTLCCQANGASISNLEANVLYNVSSVGGGLSLIQDGELGTFRSITVGDGLAIADNGNSFEIENTQLDGYEVLLRTYGINPDIETYINERMNVTVPLYYDHLAVPGNTFGLYYNLSFPNLIALDVVITTKSDAPFWPVWFVIDGGGGLFAPPDQPLLLPRPGETFNITLYYTGSHGIRVVQTGTYVDAWDMTTTVAVTGPQSVDTIGGSTGLLLSATPQISSTNAILETYGTGSAGFFNLQNISTTSAWLEDFRIRGRTIG